MLSNKQYEYTCEDCGREHTTADSCSLQCPHCGGSCRRTARFGTCPCGNEVEFSRFTNTCHRCERDYNSAGQELAARSQWGEETGESVAAILSVDATTTDDCFEDDDHA